MYCIINTQSLLIYTILILYKLEKVYNTPGLTNDGYTINPP